MKNKNKDPHPSLDIIASHGNELSNKKIVLCIAGSVAAYKSIELARLLMRHGADVRCIISKAASKLIKPDYLKWATGNPVISKLTGDLEHIKLADYKRSDLIIVYPATANILGKLANGIDDTPIATVLTVALGSKIPITICLAMHRSMYDNVAIKKNIEFLKNRVSFVSPKFLEGKAKIAEPDEVLRFILKKFGYSSVLAHKKILITAGPTIEYIDPVRVITNLSSGKTGILLASELLVAGSKVTLIYGPGTHKPPKGIRTISVKTTNEMFDVLKKELKKRPDIVILAAAASDYTPERPRKRKIPSSKSRISISFKRIPKMINYVKKNSDVFLVGFKAETAVSKSELISAARKKMKETKADLIIANDIGTERYQKNPNNNEVIIIDSKNAISTGWKSKEKIVKLIVKAIEKKVEKNQH